MRIEAQGINVQLGGKPVLFDACLNAASGELLGLIGPNGAGKSTLLRVIARLQQPATGAVAYAGRAASAFSDRELAQRIAYLAQAETVCWPLSVENVVALGRLPHRGGWGGLSAADQAAIQEALRVTDTLGLCERAMTTLSVGERARVLLARALAVQAQVLLVDEPAAALDPYHQLQIMGLLRRQADQGHTIIAVLHDLTHAARFCDRLLLLAGGRMVASGTPEAVLSDEQLRDTYRISALRGEQAGEKFVLPWQSHPAIPAK